MGNDWGSMLAGGLTQEGFSEEGTLGAEPALGGPGGGCLRWWEREEPAPRPGDGLGWSKTKVKPEWLGRVSEGKVGEDVCGGIGRHQTELGFIPRGRGILRRRFRLGWGQQAESPCSHSGKRPSRFGSVEGSGELDGFGVDFGGRADRTCCRTGVW